MVKKNTTRTCSKLQKHDFYHTGCLSSKNDSRLNLTEAKEYSRQSVVEVEVWGRKDDDIHPVGVKCQSSLPVLQDAVLHMQAQNK